MGRGDWGRDRKPQAVSGIVEAGGRGPNTVHRGTSGNVLGNRNVPGFVIVVT